MPRKRVSHDSEAEANETPVSYAVFNPSLQAVQCTSVDGKTQVTFPPLTRVSLHENEISAEMHRHFQRGSLERSPSGQAE